MVLGFLFSALGSCVHCVVASFCWSTLVDVLLCSALLEVSCSCFFSCYLSHHAPVFITHIYSLAGTVRDLPVATRTYKTA